MIEQKYLAMGSPENDCSHVIIALYGYPCAGNNTVLTARRRISGAAKLDKTADGRLPAMKVRHRTKPKDREGMGW